MNRPTEAEEVRAEPAGRRLDALVAEYVMGWPRVKELDSWPQHHGAPVGIVVIDERAVYGHDRAQRFSCPGATFADEWRCSTDPAACAELQRHLWASGKWQFTETRINRDAVTVVLVSEPNANGPNVFVEHREPVGTDPIAAEMLAWCKVALLASAPVPNSA